MEKLMSDRSGSTIRGDEIVGRLKKNLMYRSVIRQIAAQATVNRVANERGISITTEDIEAEAERMRRDKRLEKASDTHKWLSEQMIAVEDWEAGIGDRLLSQALAKDLFDKEVESYFAQNKLDYDLLALYRIVVPNEALAQEIFYQVQEEEISFYEAAHLHDNNEMRRYCCGFEGKIYRWSLSADIAPTIWSAKIGEVIGPLQLEEMYHLFWVEDCVSATLTPDIRKAIIDKMFNDWLDRELQLILEG